MFRNEYKQEETKVCMPAKLRRMVAYLDGLLSIKTYDSLITLSKTTITPLSESLWLSNLVVL